MQTMLDGCGFESSFLHHRVFSAEKLTDEMRGTPACGGRLPTCLVVDTAATDVSGVFPLRRIGFRIATTNEQSSSSLRCIRWLPVRIQFPPPYKSIDWAISPCRNTATGTPTGTPEIYRKRYQPPGFVREIPGIGDGKCEALRCLVSILR
jgi:hypothetical protein